jgi:hypothetical protein
MSNEEISVKTTVNATPELLARLFWNMDSGQQMEFFSALYHEIQVSRDESHKNKHLIGEYGDGQWYFLRQSASEMPQPKQLNAINTLRAIAAPFYLYTVGFDWERFPHQLGTRS